jgi:hypothetical protein
MTEITSIYSRPDGLPAMAGAAWMMAYTTPTAKKCSLAASYRIQGNIKAIESSRREPSILHLFSSFRDRKPLALQVYFSHAIG